MPKFAANLSMLYNEVPFMERFDKAGAAGFKAVEFLYPYAFSAADIKAKLDSNGLALVLHNIPAGDWDGGERGIACLPDRVDEYRAGVAKAIEYAKALGVPQLNCLAGKAPASSCRLLLKVLRSWMKSVLITPSCNTTFTMHNVWKVNLPTRCKSTSHALAICS